MAHEFWRYGAGPSEQSGDGHGRGIWDLTPREYLIVVPLVAAILFLGVYPKPVLERIQPSAVRSCVVAREGGTVLPGAAGLSRLVCDVGTVGPAPGRAGSTPLSEAN